MIQIKLLNIFLTANLLYLASNYLDEVNRIIFIKAMIVVLLLVLKKVLVCQNSAFQTEEQNSNQSH